MAERFNVFKVPMTEADHLTRCSATGSSALRCLYQILQTCIMMRYGRHEKENYGQINRKR